MTEKNLLVQKAVGLLTTLALFAIIQPIKSYLHLVTDGANGQITVMERKHAIADSAMQARPEIGQRHSRILSKRIKDKPDTAEVLQQY